MYAINNLVDSIPPWFTPLVVEKIIELASFYLTRTCGWHRICMMDLTITGHLLSYISFLDNIV